MESPKVYKLEDVKELAAWFEQHKADIPESLVINKSTSYPNLKKSISNLIKVAETNWAFTTFAGYIYRLEEIRQKLLESKS